MIDWDALRLSFAVAALGTAMALVVGVCLAGLLATFRFPGRDLVDALVTAPLVVPPTVLGYYVLTVLGRESAIGRAWESITGATIVFTFTGLVVAAFLGALPLIVKSARAAMEQVDPQLVGAARTLGAGRVRAFVTIVLPLARGGVVAGAALGLARALGDFGVTLMIAGNIQGRTRTASLSIYDAVMAGDDAAANGLAALLAALAVAALTLANRLTRRSDAHDEA
jgi:molybdate transport system permease protein